ncbi:MAG: stage III sporulation protein AB [Ruminococcaceae bacterium]|nr:stage III sporulation protein AB [Oscillospiraceae bacterium]
MKCAWEPFLSVLPPGLRDKVDKYGKDEPVELRLRLGQPAELVMCRTNRSLDKRVTEEDIRYVVNTASRYSPWAASTIGKGYVTAPGGHRIGICGECVIKDGTMTGIRTVTSLCIRIARDFPGIGKEIPTKGSLLILGPPGAGKTTLLRDLIRMRSIAGAITVVDERGELFSSGQAFDTGPRTDILTGCSKAQGIEIALRTMGPKCIAVDEITALEDCQALINAAWCGVELLATAHAEKVDDLHKRAIYRPLLSCGVFSQAVVLGRDRFWRMERMGICT